MRPLGVLSLVGMACLAGLTAGTAQAQPRFRGPEGPPRAGQRDGDRPAPPWPRGWRQGGGRPPWIDAADRARRDERSDEDAPATRERGERPAPPGMRERDRGPEGRPRAAHRRSGRSRAGDARGTRGRGRARRPGPPAMGRGEERGGAPARWRGAGQQFSQMRGRGPQRPFGPPAWGRRAFGPRGMNWAARGRDFRFQGPPQWAGPWRGGFPARRFGQLNRGFTRPFGPPAVWGGRYRAGRNPAWGARRFGGRTFGRSFAPARGRFSDPRSERADAERDERRSAPAGWRDRQRPSAGGPTWSGAPMWNRLRGPAGMGRGGPFGPRMRGDGRPPRDDASPSDRDADRREPEDDKGHDDKEDDDKRDDEKKVDDKEDDDKREDDEDEERGKRDRRS